MKIRFSSHNRLPWLRSAVFNIIAVAMPTMKASVINDGRCWLTCGQHMQAPVWSKPYTHAIRMKRHNNEQSDKEG
jgi:hypothetical protein